jgi:hypothetical protein
MGLVQGADPLQTPGASDPVCLGLILQPVTPPLSLCTRTCVCLFFLSSLLGGVAAGHSHCHVWLAALDVCQPALWILSTMAGVPTVPRGRYPCA